MEKFSYELVLQKLEEYCEKELWKGYDPYDGLNSKLFKVLPLKSKPLFRLGWCYLIRNIPFNIRPFLLISRGYNPKALALFIFSYVRLYKLYGDKRYLCKAKFLARLLEEKQITKFRGPSWGYNFPWQSKALYAPEGIPNAICTTFAGQAFLDLQGLTGGDSYLKLSRSICDFILNDLNRLETPKGICFSYTPLDQVWVHNVNLWIAAYLARVWSLTGEDFLLDFARRAVEFTLSHQNPDGSWYYGTGNKHLLYIDNYHTGFNIVALKDFIDYSGEKAYQEALLRGFNYYTKTFFLSNGAPRYYHNKIFPMDIHCCAQGIITHTAMGYFEKADKIALWAFDNLFDKKKGFFYYRKLPAYVIKIPFIRWGEAWMHFALTFRTTAAGIS